eukprot:10525136-Lingulodinium_polyedra.AAC.1
MPVPMRRRTPCSCLVDTGSGGRTALARPLTPSMPLFFGLAAAGASGVGLLSAGPITTVTA